MKIAIILALMMITLPLSGASKLSEEDQPTVKVQPIASDLPSEKAIWGIAEDQLDELFTKSSDLVCLSDPRFLYRVNTAWTSTLGWTKEELLNQPYAQIIHPQDLPTTEIVAHQATHSSLIHKSEISSDVSQDRASKIPMLLNFENRFQARSGNYYILQWLALLQVSGPKLQPPILGIAKNITLQKQAEEQKLALERAQAATKMKSTFVAHMSHEIRTPLNGILGFIELALEEQMSDKVRTYLQYAHDSALLLLGIANDIIDVSRIEAGALKVEKVDFNPAFSLESVIGILTLQAEKKKITLKSKIRASLPTRLKGDQNRLKQILLNLGSNAIKFTSQGKVSMTLEGQPHTQDPHLFVLRGRVKDTGMGMEPSFIQQLFQPFSQEDQPMNRQFGGAGLGLYITKQLCEKMGGSIQVLSTPGVGSTFQFQVMLESPADISPDVKGHVSSSFSIQLPIKEVLVVDDNAMNQKVLKELLTRLGCHVDLAEDGLKALEAVRQKPYELILMDGEMPHMDGLEATQKIRQQFSAQQLPIIGLTAHAMTTHREQFLESGMNGYLTKPIDRQDLITEILRCCDEARKG